MRCLSGWHGLKGALRSCVSGWSDMNHKWRKQLFKIQRHPNCRLMRRWHCFAVCFVDGKMYSPSGGRVTTVARVAINQCAPTSGILNYVTNENTSVLNVRTANLRHWPMPTFIATLKANRPIAAMWLGYMSSMRTIPVIFFALTLMTRIANTATKAMWKHSSVFVRIGACRAMLSDHAQAMALTFGCSLMRQFGPTKHDDWAIPFSRRQWTETCAYRSSLTTASSPTKTRFPKAASAILWHCRCKAEPVNKATVFLLTRILSLIPTNGHFSRELRNLQRTTLTHYCKAMLIRPHLATLPQRAKKNRGNYRCRLW